MPEPAMKLVLDTCMVSRILRRDGRAVRKLAEAARADAEILLCPVVFYEVKRGLMKRDARRQLSEFEELVNSMVWSSLRRAVWDRAARIWADCERRGRPREDADLLIAAFANQNQATLVTTNVRHFEDLNIAVEDWTGS